MSRFPDLFPFRHALEQHLQDEPTDPHIGTLDELEEIDLMSRTVEQTEAGLRDSEGVLLTFRRAPDFVYAVPVGSGPNAT